jgi:microcystin-dependent protein
MEFSRHEIKEKSMSEPFLGELRIVGYNFAPRGWAMCNGQLLAINQNAALFSILGTTYGGNGQTNFALPNFQGRAPIHVANGFALGQTGGEQNHTLSINEIPQHTHSVNGSSGNGNRLTAAGNTWAVEGSNTTFIYSNGSQDAHMAPSAIANNGGNQPHSNMQPFLVLNFIIALQGIFPSRN